MEMIEIKYGYNFSTYGLFPKDVKSLIGIILCPFIHGSTHLFNNLIPLFFLLSAMIHFYDNLYTIYIFLSIF